MTNRPTRYFVSQSGEWYRLAPNGAVHMLCPDGTVVAVKRGKSLNFENLVKASYLQETDKIHWVQACKWYRRFPE